MAIGVDRDAEFYPAINKILAKLKELEDKIDLIKSNSDLLVKKLSKKKVGQLAILTNITDLEEDVRDLINESTAGFWSSTFIQRQLKKGHQIAQIGRAHV